MWHLNTGLLIVLGAFCMVIALTAIKSAGKTRERELHAHHELRLREMEHERRMKELEIEKSKVELEKAKAVSSSAVTT